MFKKTFLLLGLLVSTVAFSQVDYLESSANVFEKKELRLGVVRLLSSNSFDICYERIIDRNQSLGDNLLIGFEANEFIGDTEQIFSISPYYRFYFNKSQEYGARGMFVEGVLQIFTAVELGITNHIIYLILLLEITIIMKKRKIILTLLQVLL